MEQETANLAFDDLPLDPIGPRGNAWGRFGPDDQLGTLNLLTPEVVTSAAKEIRTGIRISLDWPLNMPSYPSFNRDPFEQRLVCRKPYLINDDVLTFNTQCSSQWDGFRHYEANQKYKQFYQGHSQDEIESSDVLGIHVFAKSGGITGRGVLLDYRDWATCHSTEVRALESTPITGEDIEAMTRYYDIQFNKGDILFIRSGFTAVYNQLTDEERKALSNRPSPNFIGVEATEDMLRWLWDRQFAAVAGDAPSFERAPIRGTHANPDFNLHEWLLAGWGCPIGEMFDLEALSYHCKRSKRYTFFISSVPLNVVGGVASPPNAVAIF